MRISRLLCWGLAVGFDIYLIARLFLLIDQYAVNLLYWDNFNYYFLLAKRWNLWARFTAPLGPHREGFGMLLSSVIAPLTAWNMRAEAFAIGVILVIAAHVCLWVKTRAFGGLQWWDFIVIPGVFLNTIQYEVWSNTVNSSHGALPLLFVMLWCLSWTIASERLRLTCLLVIGFFATFTGFGFFLGVLTSLVLAITRKWVGLAISLASIALFFVNYRFDPANPGFKLFDPSLVYLPKAFALGLSHATNLNQGPSNVQIGYCLCIGLLVAAGSHWRGLASAEPRAIIVVSCVTFTMMFMLSASVGRISFGVPCPTTSRYFPLIVPGIVGAYFRVAEMSNRPGISPPILVSVGVALRMSLLVSPDDLRVMQYYGEQKREWIARYTATGSLDKADHSSFRPIYPDPVPPDLQSKLNFLRDHHLNFYSDPMLESH